MEPFLIILATFIYSAIHSLLASLGVKNFVRQKWGPNTDQWYRLAYNIFAGISFLPILGLLAILEDRPLYQISGPWVILTSIGQLIGVIVILLGIWQTNAGEFLGLVQIFREPSTTPNQGLIITGIYRWVRHPLYFGGFLILWFTPIMTVNLLSLYVLLSLYLVIGARLEEKRLIHEFGECYRAYQKQTPQLIPKLKSRKMIRKDRMK